MSIRQCRSGITHAGNKISDEKNIAAVLNAIILYHFGEENASKF